MIIVGTNIGELANIFMTFQLIFSSNAVLYTVAKCCCSYNLLGTFPLSMHLGSSWSLYFNVNIIFKVDGSSANVTMIKMSCKEKYVYLLDGQLQFRCIGVSSLPLLCLDMGYELKPALHRKVCFYSTYWSKGKEGQNRLLWAKLNLCWAAGSHEIKPLTMSAVFIIRWPFLCVLCCDFDVLSHNRGPTILWRACQ